jgi:hypothetical protein
MGGTGALILVSLDSGGDGASFGGKFVVFGGVLRCENWGKDSRCAGARGCLRTSSGWGNR